MPKKGKLESDLRCLTLFFTRTSNSGEYCGNTAEKQRKRQLHCISNTILLSFLLKICTAAISHALARGYQSAVVLQLDTVCLLTRFDETIDRFLSNPVPKKSSLCSRIDHDTSFLP